MIGLVVPIPTFPPIIKLFVPLIFEAVKFVALILEEVKVVIPANTEPVAPRAITVVPMAIDFPLNAPEIELDTCVGVVNDAETPVNVAYGVMALVTALDTSVGVDNVIEPVEPRATVTPLKFESAPVYTDPATPMPAELVPYSPTINAPVIGLVLAELVVI